MKKKKLFTLEEANKSLALVRPITRDIRRLWREIDVLRASEEGLSERENQFYLNRLEHHLVELYQLGCNLEDPQKGAVRFPSKHDNLPVELSWKFGEEEVMFWALPGEDERHPISQNVLSNPHAQ